MQLTKRIIGHLLLAFFSGSLAWPGDGQGIKGSAHDFTGESWNPALGNAEICRTCHVPHDHGRARYLNGLLWNHAVSSATYTLYDSSWSSSIKGVSSQPDGNSKLCLACHDGTVAIDTFDKYAGGQVFMGQDVGNVNKQISRFMDGANIDLRGTHPVSITYPAAKVGMPGGLRDPDAALWSNGATVASTLQNGKLQCSTCHDVHNVQSVPYTQVLRAAMTVDLGGASALCLTCHNK